MICTNCLSKSVYGPVWQKTRKIKSIFGGYEFKIDVMKCLSCEKWHHAENKYAPFGSRWDWKTIKYVIRSDKGHTELMRSIARDYGVHLHLNTIREMRIKYAD